MESVNSIEKREHVFGSSFRYRESNDLIESVYTSSYKISEDEQKDPSVTLESSTLPLEKVSTYTEESVDCVESDEEHDQEESEVEKEIVETEDESVKSSGRKIKLSDPRVNSLKLIIYKNRDTIIIDLRLDPVNICDICLLQDICLARRNTCKCDKEKLYTSRRNNYCYNDYMGKCVDPDDIPDTMVASENNRKCTLDYSSRNVVKVINSIRLNAYKIGGYNLLEKYNLLFEDICVSNNSYILEYLLNENSETNMSVLEPLFRTENRTIDYNIYLTTFNLSTSESVLETMLNFISNNKYDIFKNYTTIQLKFEEVLNHKMIRLLDFYFNQPQISDEADEINYNKMTRMMEPLLIRGVRLTTRYLSKLKYRNYNIQSTNISYDVLKQPKNVKMIDFLCTAQYCDSASRKSLGKSVLAGTPLFAAFINNYQQE